MSAGVIKLSQLLESRVEDEDGRSLGRVHDVRVRRVTSGDPAHAALYEVEGLIIGREGLLVRLGIAGARSRGPAAGVDPLPWRDVLRLERGQLVVRRQT